MKYNRITIKPENNGWKTTLSYDDMDRVEQKPVPNALGFFHCPETIPVETGIKMLQDTMIKAHEEEIERLKKSLAALKNL